MNEDPKRAKEIAESVKAVWPTKPKTLGEKLKAQKAPTKLDELVSKLTNKHAQGRATQEWQALFSIAKMDGTTNDQAIKIVRDILNVRLVLAIEAIAGELHGVNQGVANANLFQELLHPDVLDKAVADAEAEAAAEEEGEAKEDAELPDEVANALTALDNLNKALGMEEDKTPPAGTQVSKQVEP